MASAKTRQIYFPALWGFSQKLLLFCFKTSEIHTKAAINLAPLNGLAQKIMKKFLDISNTSERIWFLLKSTIGISLHKRLVRFRISGFLSGSQGLRWHCCLDRRAQSRPGDNIQLNFRNCAVAGFSTHGVSFCSWSHSNEEQFYGRLRECYFLFCFW